MNTSFLNSARLLGAALRALLVLTVLTGVVYPLAVTGVAQAFFAGQANGSEIKDSSGQVVGSALIGQSYADDLDYFQGRPQSGLGTNTVNTQYKLILSGATNLAADNPKLIASVRAAQAAVIKDNSTPGHPVTAAQVPPDAVTSSGSGLDPDISPAYAQLQVRRVAERNHLTVAAVTRLVREHSDGRTLGFIGDPTVNVLQLNIALKALAEK
jgi:K+-transporting ATPase ATPase C chain